MNIAPLNKRIQDEEGQPPARSITMPAVWAAWFSEVYSILTGKVASAVQAASAQSLSGSGVGTEQFAKVTGANFSTASLTLVDITMDTPVALEENATYEFEAYIIAQCVAGSTAGVKLGVNFSAAGATIEGENVGANQFGGTVLITDRITAFNTPGSTVLAGSAVTGGYHFNGILVTGANPGNLTMQILKVTSGTATVFVNSYLKAKRRG